MLPASFAGYDRILEQNEVLQGFFLAATEGGARFDPARERAVIWMKRVVREIARRQRAERERGWEVALGSR